MTISITNNQGDERVTNVAQGTANNDVVNVEQLNAAIASGVTPSSFTAGQDVEATAGASNTVALNLSAAVRQEIANKGSSQSHEHYLQSLAGNQVTVDSPAVRLGWMTHGLAQSSYSTVASCSLHSVTTIQPEPK